MYILTDGKNYVMRNPIQQDRFLQTTSPINAEKFTFKQARALLRSKKAAMKWIKDYQMVDCNDGSKCEISPNYEGNGGVYLGDNPIDFDESIIDVIMKEGHSILGMAAWDMNQLETYKVMLDSALSYYDSAISDIEHAIEKKSPPAHIRTKIYGVLKQVREKHTQIKQCIVYVEVMKDAITYKYDLSKLKLEISKAKYTEYKGRTDYYEMILNMIG